MRYAWLENKFKQSQACVTALQSRQPVPDPVRLPQSSLEHEHELEHGLEHALAHELPVCPRCD
jgi:hypothetical protein